MSDDPEFVYRMGNTPETVLRIQPDGRCFARSVAGEMVQVKLTTKDALRLSACTGPGPNTVFDLLRILCEIIARELPVQRPS